MKYKFYYWNSESNREKPWISKVASVLDSDPDKIDVLTFLFLDTEYQNHEYFEGFIDDLSKIENAAGIAGNVWEGYAPPYSEYVRVYNVYFPENKEYTTYIHRKTMYKLMKRWYSFIKREIDEDYYEIVEA